MQITINNEPIDFTLQDERKLGQVVSGIRDWLQESGYEIRSLKNESGELTYDQGETWESKPVDDVGELHIEAVTQTELTQEKTDVIRQYFQLLGKSIDEAPVVAHDLLVDSEAVAELVEDTVGTGEASAFRTAASQYIQEQTDEPAEALRSLCDTMVVITSDLIKEATDPVKELFAVAGLLKRNADDLNEVPVLLQTGKDKEAIDSVLRFLDLAQRLMRLFARVLSSEEIDPSSLTPSGLPLNRFFDELNGFLTELGEALNTGDTVSIGDLLEYEISPRVGDLVDLIGCFDSNAT